ncbi:MAG: hypothetical protein ABI314_01325 [Gemmatimonadaceae bacterium]
MSEVIDQTEPAASAPSGSIPSESATDSMNPLLSGDDHRARRPAATPRMQVRAADLEPYVGLRYLSRLFKLMAVVLILLLVSEVITGLVTSGVAALPALLGEVSRLVVFAGLLWGSGDLAILLIDMGHDLRATRILVGRQLANSMDVQHARIDPRMSHPVPEPERPV